MLLEHYSKIDPSWKEKLSGSEYLVSEIQAKVKSISHGKRILPEPEDVFRVLMDSNFDDISVVIIGQDPYHQTPCLPNGTEIPQATGLAFSVPQGVKPPPSLKNIYKELSSCYPDFISPEHGDLSKWTKEVLLLNTALTVEHSNAGAHAKTGWSEFTSRIIKVLIERKKPLVFLAWGKHAHAVVREAEGTHHKVIKTSHPSPLGARKSGEGFCSFLGSRCFIEANEFLESSSIKPINWHLS